MINRDFHFKLCDFGSVCGIIRPPKNLEELNYAKNDLLANTTAQYRPPEILQIAINNQINIRIDEKSDIWALGFTYTSFVIIQHLLNSITQVIMVS